MSKFPKSQTTGYRVHFCIGGHPEHGGSAWQANPSKLDTSTATTKERKKCVDV